MVLFTINHVEMGSEDEKHAHDYNFSLSLSSSIRGTAAEFVSHVLTVMDYKIQEIERPLSQDSSEGEQEENQSQAASVKEANKKMDPEALAAMSESDSASYNDFNNDEGLAFTGICTDVIDQKIRGVLRSMTGMEGVDLSNPAPASTQKEEIKEASETQKDKRKSLGTVRSSVFSEGVVEIAKNYLIDVYSQASRTLLNGTQEDIDQLNHNEIEFVRVVTEESLSSDHSMPKMAQEYLGGIFNK